MPGYELFKRVIVLALIALVATSFLLCTKVDFDNILSTPDGSKSVLPVITIKTDNNPDTIIVNSLYKIPSAEATITVDDSLVYLTSDDITSTGSVETATEGVYEIIYTATDSAGNIAYDTLIVVVVDDTTDIVDTVAPVVTISGANPLSVDSGSSYSNPPATATDNVDSNFVDDDIVKFGTVDIDNPGSYSVIYSVTDAAGNEGKDTLVVNVISVPVADTTPPVITISGDNPLEIEIGTSYSHPSATAVDDVDGNIHDFAFTKTGTVDVNTPGSYSVIYSVTDTAGNEGRDTLVVNVVAAADNTPPVITISGDNPLEIEKGTSFSNPTATAVDDVDGNIHDFAFTKTGTVDVNTPGSYSVIYSVTDSAGNEGRDTLVVNVVEAADNTPPVITISGDNPLEIEMGASYSDPTATAVDDVDGNIHGFEFTKTGTVNVNAVGQYKVIYSVKDAAGNEAKDTLVVNVVPRTDSIPPVITISGNNPLVIYQGSAYNHPSATAVDNVDGNIPNNKITKTGTVNVNAIGQYSVTYSVSDKANNKASKTLVVKVIPNEPDPCEGVDDWSSTYAYSSPGIYVVYDNKLYKSLVYYTKGDSPATTGWAWEYIDDCQ